MALSHVEGNCKEENAALHDQCGWDKKEQASGEQWKVKIGPESERGGMAKIIQPSHHLFLIAGIARVT